MCAKGGFAEDDVVAVSKLGEIEYREIPVDVKPEVRVEGGQHLNVNVLRREKPCWTRLSIRKISAADHSCFRLRGTLQLSDAGTAARRNRPYPLPKACKANARCENAGISRRFFTHRWTLMASRPRLASGAYRYFRIAVALLHPRFLFFIFFLLRTLRQHFLRWLTRQLLARRTGRRAQFIDNSGFQRLFNIATNLTQQQVVMSLDQRNGGPFLPARPVRPIRCR